MIWYLILKSGLLLARLLPRRLCIALWEKGFRAAGRFSPARSTVAANLEAIAAAGGASRAPDEVYAGYGRYWGEWLAALAAPKGRGRLRIPWVSSRLCAETCAPSRGEPLESVTTPCRTAG